MSIRTMEIVIICSRCRRNGVAGGKYRITTVAARGKYPNESRVAGSTSIMD